MRRLIILCVALLAGCGDDASSPSSTEAAITHGETVRDGNGDDALARSMGALVSDDTEICSGFFVAKNVVMTAGHCLQRRPAEFLFGRGGPMRVGQDGVAQMRDLLSFDKYPVLETKAFGSVGGADIGLAKVADRPRGASEPYPRSTVSLDDIRSPAVGTDCVALGYGLNVFDSRRVAMFGALRRGAVRITAVDARVFGIGYTEGTLDEPGGQPGPGDSGGPLACAGRVVGVLSGGNRATPDPADERWRGEAIRIDALLAEIKAEISGMSR